MNKMTLTKTSLSSRDKAEHYWNKSSFQRHKSVYKRRAQMKEMRMIYSHLSDLEKQSPQYADLVFEVETVREKKKLENARYKRKREDKNGQLKLLKLKNKPLTTLEKFLDSFELNMQLFDSL